jgi:hypothetical protein
MKIATTKKLKGKIPLLTKLITLCSLLTVMYFLNNCKKEEPTTKNPIIVTASISNISTNSAVSGGNITSDGGGTIIAKGIVWSTITSPTISLSTKSLDGTGIGIFSSNLNGLSIATKYFVRAYATNSSGTAYGDEITFTTSSDLPTLTSNPITNITSTTASGGGTISSDGGGTITTRGIVWSTGTFPTISLTTKTADGTGIGNFSSNLTGLSLGTKYYVRSYAINSAGTAYGNEISFTTAADGITAPPSFLNLNSFYKKYLNASGIPIISSDKVPDLALYNAQRVVNKMVTFRSDVLLKLIENNFRVAIIATTEVITDTPENSDLYTAFPGTDWNKNRGLTGSYPLRPITVSSEENALCSVSDPYSNEDILIHETAHGIHLNGIRLVDITIDAELQQAFNDAKDKGLWINTYAGSNYIEYFAEGVQDWFNVNAEAIPTNGVHNQINTRDELKNYDLTLYNIIKRYFTDDNEIVSCHQ